MSYLLDRKIRRGKFLRAAGAIMLLGLLLYFRSTVFDVLSSAIGTVSRPIFAFGNGTMERISGIGSYFRSKAFLYRENEHLREELITRGAEIANYETIQRENEALKAMLGRVPERDHLLLGAILAKPNRSPYDTLILDVGQSDGVQAGQRVFADGDIPIGRIDMVMERSSKAVLYSSPLEKTQVIVPTSISESGHSDVFWEITGRGGGDFEMILPREFALERGDEAVLPGHTPYAVAITEAILSDPRDPFKKALLRSPINIQDLKFVYIETSP